MLGRKSIVVAASVATLMSAAVVTAPLADAKPKAKAPAKVAKARQTAASTNAVIITWSNPKSKNFKATVVRVAAGAKAPKSVKAGRGIATVSKKKHGVAITRLAAGTVYTVALFSSDGKKHFSKPVALRIRTANAPKPPAPKPPAPPAPKPTTGSVVGTVFGGDSSTRVASADVYLDSHGNGDEIDQTSGPDGSFTFANLAPGVYDICASSDGVQGSPAGYVYSCADDDITVVAGSSASGNVTLLKAVAFAGTVQDSANNKIDNVTVQARDEDGDDVGDSTQTGSDGKYSLTGLRNSVSEVCFYPGSGGAADYGYASQCVPVSPTPGEVTPVNVTLESAGALNGTVNGKKGAATTPLELVAVYAVSADSGNVVREADSTSTGSFEVVGLPAGQYSLCYDASNVDPDVTGVPLGFVSACKTASGVVAWSGDTDSLPAGAAKYQVSSGNSSPVTASTLQQGGGLSGTVTTADSITSNVTVNLYSSAKVYLKATSLTDEGTYKFTSLAAGKYFVCFESDGAAGDSDNGHLSECYDNKPWSSGEDLPSGLTAIDVNPSVETTGKDAQLASAGAIDGTVLAADGGDVDVRVSAYDADGNRVTSDYVSEGDHSFHLAGLTSGSYKVCIYAYDNHASRCYQGKAWDGDSGNIPADATPLQVVAGAAPQSITETLVNG